MPLYPALAPLPSANDRRGAWRWVAVGGIYLVAAVALLVPTLLLATAVLALGADFGWWAGDPTDNDGLVLFRLVLGVGCWAVVLGVAGWGARRLGPAHPRLVVGVASVVLVIGYLAWGVGWVW